MFANVGLFTLSFLGSLNGFTNSINENNIFETFLMGFPLVYSLVNSIQTSKWSVLIQYMRTGSMK